MPEITETFMARDAAAWRRWLARNHQKKTEIWLILFKKHTGKECVSYDEAVEEALCVGWIDGILKRIDDEKHVVRFSPRKPRSVWSLVNKKRVEQLIREGRMQEFGLELVEAAKKSGQWQKAYGKERPKRMPADLKAALERNKRAIANFGAFPPSAKQMYITWVLAAKRDETRKKRIREVVRRAAQNKRPGIQ